MKVLLLTLELYGSGGEEAVVSHWVCATREACFKVLRNWVDKQNGDIRAMGETSDCSACGMTGVEGEYVNQLTDNPVNLEDKSLQETEEFHCYACIDKVTDPVEAYFATSEDLYEIVEYEVQA